jgi:hypothetical protein
MHHELLMAFEAIRGHQTRAYPIDLELRRVHRAQRSRRRFFALSTAPIVKGTPLQGPNTNLAGVFQINDVSQVKGLTRTFNSWIVTSAGFFGKNVKATPTVYAVNGTAPALTTGNEQPISNVIHETFTIAA